MLKVGDMIELPRDITFSRKGEFLVVPEGTKVYISGHGSVVTEDGIELFVKTPYMSNGVNPDGLANYLANRLLELDPEDWNEDTLTNTLSMYFKIFGIR